MRVYKKVREFFSFLGDIYFKPTTYDNLEEQNTQQINKNLELSGEVGRFKQRAESLSYQYKTEAAKAEQLAFKNQELTNTITTLSKELGGLEESVGGLTEQKNFLTEELATAQAQVQQYQKGVLKSPEYILLAKEKTELETQKNVLEDRVEELKKVCMFRQETIKDIRETLRDYMNQYRNTMEAIFEKEAENDNRALSYVVVDVFGMIIASTTTFRENFHHDEIKGTKCFSVLKAPEPNGNAENWIRLTAFLRDQGEDSLEATILDGKRNHRNVYLEKQKPTIIQCTEYDENGKPNNYTLVYRRIDTHDIGFWKKFSKEHRKRKVKSIDEYFAVLKLDEVEIENKEFRKAMDYYSSRLRNKGLNLTQVLRVWDKLRKKERDYENWRRGCAELILEKRKADRKKREKQQKTDKPPKTT